MVEFMLWMCAAQMDLFVEVFESRWVWVHDPRDGWMLRGRLGNPRSRELFIKMIDGRWHYRQLGWIFPNRAKLL